MPALAYLLLPISGMAAYFLSTTERGQFHGAQAVAMGFVWPITLYVSSFVAPVATQVVFALGMIVWIGLIVTTAVGKDLRLPYVGALCARAAGLEEPT